MRNRSTSSQSLRSDGQPSVMRPKPSVARHDSQPSLGTRAEPHGKLCPSAPPVVGATVLGVIQPDGTVGYVTPRLVVDDSFLERGRRGRSIDKRFRFASECAVDACAHWGNGECSLIAAIVSRGRTDRSSLPRCSIRPRCRWFSQAGAAACRLCPTVVTNTEESTR